MRKILRSIYLGLVLIFLLFQGGLFCSAPVEEITVKADLNLQVDSEKPKVTVNFNKNEILKDPIELETDILSVSPDDLDDVLPALPLINFSKNTISPFLIDILSEPILRFRMKAAPNFKAKKWKINIMDAKGELFSIIDGKKDFPEVIEWDGRNSKGDMIIPGKWYSYNLIVTEELGNEYKIQGENFIIKGVFYKKDKFRVISLSLIDLFDIETDNDEISNEGQKLLRELLDIIKGNYKNPMRLVVYDNKEEVGLKRGQKILEYIVTNLYIQDIKINIQFVPSYISDYRIDLEIYKK